MEDVEVGATDGTFLDGDDDSIGTRENGVRDGLE
jgi:hypothetical protein